MRTSTQAGLAIMIALSVSACSLVGGSDEPSTPPPASAPASAPATAPTAPATTAGAPTPADPSQSGGNAQLGQPAGTRTSSSSGQPLEITLYPVVRDGTTSHLNLTMTSPGDAVLSVGTLLSDGNPEASDSTGTAADGIQLVDGKNAKLYLVASDGAGQCLCTRDLRFLTLKEGAQVILSATFAAPPADVTTVDVIVPSFGTVKDVPVQ